METTYGQDPVWCIKVLEGILVGSCFGGAQGIVAQGLEDPQSNEQDHYEEQEQRQKHDPAIR